MIDSSTRAWILRLRDEGRTTRSIARALGLSCIAVRHVLLGDASVSWTRRAARHALRTGPMAKEEEDARQEHA